MAVSDTYVRARIDNTTKERATAALGAMGLSISDAIRLLMLRIADERRLPFEVKVPNAATREAMAELAAGARYPAKLLRAIQRAGADEAAVQRVGVHYATEQCRDLLENGVDGIHFYTLNKSQATREIYASLGIRDSAAVRPA